METEHDTPPETEERSGPVRLDPETERAILATATRHSRLMLALAFAVLVVVLLPAMVVLGAGHEVFSKLVLFMAFPFFVFPVGLHLWNRARLKSVLWDAFEAGYLEGQILSVSPHRMDFLMRRRATVVRGDSALDPRYMSSIAVAWTDADERRWSTELAVLGKPSEIPLRKGSAVRLLAAPGRGDGGEVIVEVPVAGWTLGRVQRDTPATAPPEPEDEA